MSLFGSPEVITALARTVHDQADALTSVGSALVTASLPPRCNWACTKADRFRQRQGDRRGRCSALATELYALATELQTLATRVEGEIAFVHRVESQVRRVIGDLEHAAADVVRPWTGTAWGPANLPPVGDAAWLEVGRAFGLL